MLNHCSQRQNLTSTGNTGDVDFQHELLICLFMFIKWLLLNISPSPLIYVIVKGHCPNSVRQTLIVSDCLQC